MRKTLVTLLTAAMLSVPTVAVAAVDPGTPNTGAPQTRPAQNYIRLCVTTTWREQHTHQHKTRPGEVCIFTHGMWLPKSYKVLVTHLALANSGPLADVMIVQRPWR